MHKAGGRIAFAEDALVYEPVPSGRATRAWLTKRRFRMGQTHGRILLEHRQVLADGRQLCWLAPNPPIALPAAALLAAFPVQRHRYGLRGIMHAGVVSGLFGVREIEQYGSLEKAPQ